MQGQHVVIDELHTLYDEGRQGQKCVGRDNLKITVPTGILF